MKLPFIRDAISLLAYPQYVKRISREHHEYINRPSTMNSQVEAEPWAEAQVTRLRRAWIRALVTVVVVVLLAWTGGQLLGRIVVGNVQIWQNGIQYLGAALLLWATLGQGGWSIQSMKGSTYVEQLDGWVHQLIHVVGTFLFVLGTAWSTTTAPPVASPAAAAAAAAAVTTKSYLVDFQ